MHHVLLTKFNGNEKLAIFIKVRVFTRLFTKSASLSIFLYILKKCQNSHF